LKLEDAIRKMTSLPAQRFLLKDRGTLEEGYWADLVIFDIESMRDATFENSKQYPEGIPYVMVNGQWVIKENQFTGQLPGRLAGRK
jgi:N-acyl-D-amino-acid deacylase